MGKVESTLVATLPARGRQRLRWHSDGRKYFPRSRSHGRPVHQSGRLSVADSGNGAHTRRAQYTLHAHPAQVTARGTHGRRIAGAGICMSEASRPIAILGGTGPAGTGIALRWARAGETIIIGSRDAQRAQEAAERIKQKAGNQARVSGMENSAAC